MPDYSGLLEAKLDSSIPNNVRNNLRLIGINKDDVHFIGSYNYRVQKYPGDFDGIEFIIGNDKDKLYNKVFKGIRDVINTYMKLPYKYIMELKAGIDPRYNTRIADIYGYKVKINKKFRKDLEKLKKEELIRNDDYHQILNLMDEIRQTKDVDKKFYNYEKINQIIRKYNVIRWTPEEIKKGFKIKNGHKFNLKDALMDEGKINIEALNLINGKVSDISNFLLLTYIDEKGNERILNIPSPSGDFNFDFKVNLMTGIINIFYSVLDYNPFKALKRLWSFARQSEIKDVEMLKMLEPIISSDVSLASKVKSDISTIQKVIDEEMIDHFGPKLISNQIQSIKGNLSNSLIFNQNELEELNKYFDLLSELVEKSDKNFKVLKKILDDDHSANNLIEYADAIISTIKKKLSEKINKHTEDFMKKIGIYDLYPFLKKRYPLYVK